MTQNAKETPSVNILPDGWNEAMEAAFPIAMVDNTNWGHCVALGIDPIQVFSPPKCDGDEFALYFFATTPEQRNDIVGRLQAPQDASTSQMRPKGHVDPDTGTKRTAKETPSEATGRVVARLNAGTFLSGTRTRGASPVMVAMRVIVLEAFRKSPTGKKQSQSANEKAVNSDTKAAMRIVTDHFHASTKAIKESGQTPDELFDRLWNTWWKKAEANVAAEAVRKAGELTMDDGDLAAVLAEADPAPSGPTGGAS